MNTARIHLPVFISLFISTSIFVTLFDLFSHSFTFIHHVQLHVGGTDSKILTWRATLPCLRVYTLFVVLWQIKAYFSPSLSIYLTLSVYRHASSFIVIAYRFILRWLSLCYKVSGMYWQLTCQFIALQHYISLPCILFAFNVKSY